MNGFFDGSFNLFHMLIGNKWDLLRLLTKKGDGSFNRSVSGAENTFGDHLFEKLLSLLGVSTHYFMITSVL